MQRDTPNSPLGPQDGGLSDWEQPIAQYVVRDFIDERGLLPGIEGEDLVQEVMIHWLEQRDRYSPSSGASVKTFFRKIAKNRLEDIFRQQKAGKRGGKNITLSLDQPVGGEEDDNHVLGDSIPDPGDVALEAEGEAERDLMLEPLTSRQKELAEGLAQGYTLADMARKMNVPRTTLKDELNRIRRLFRQHGYGSTSA